MTQTPYLILGGEEKLLELVKCFYQIMDTDPKASRCRGLHEKDLALAELKLFEFLSGWLGGPDLFVAKYGHPKMRMRHFKFKISKIEKDEWLYCMDLALNRIVHNPNLRLMMMQAFGDLAQKIQNVEDEL